MILDGDRSALDAALGDDASTAMVLKGWGGADNGDLHDRAVDVTQEQPWRLTFLVRDGGLLTSAERSRWFSSGAEYAVLGGEVPKKLGPKGPREDLLLASGAPSGLKIRSTFAEGDQL